MVASCGDQLQEEREHFVERATALLGTGLVIDPMRFRGPICINGTCAEYGNVSRAVDLPPGSHAITTSNSREVGSTVEPLGVVIVDAEGRVSLGSSHFDEAPGNRLAARTVKVRVDTTGNERIGFVGLEYRSERDWDEWLIADRRYALQSMDSVDLDGANNRFSSGADPFDVAVTATGVTVDPAQTGRHFTAATDGTPKLTARTRTFVLQHQGYAGWLVIAGEQRWGPTWPPKVILDRRYSIAANSHDLTVAETPFAPGARFGLKVTAGAVEVLGDLGRYFSARTVGNESYLEPRIGAMTVTSAANFSGSFCIGDVACGSGPGATVVAFPIPGRRYYAGANATLPVQVEDDGSCASTPALALPGGTVTVSCRAITEAAGSTDVAYRANLPPETVDGHPGQPGVQRWSHHANVAYRGRPVTDDGVLAWQLDTTGDVADIAEEFWSIPVAAADAARGQTDGWTLTARVKVLGPNQLVAPGTAVNHDDGTRTWALLFGSNAAGEPVVGFVDEAAALPVASRTHTVTGGANQYNTYALRYDPATSEAALLVNGQVALRGLRGVRWGPPSGYGLTVSPRVDFGDLTMAAASGPAAGRANFEHVTWEKVGGPTGTGCGSSICDGQGGQPVHRVLIDTTSLGEISYVLRDASSEFTVALMGGSIQPADLRAGVQYFFQSAPTAGTFSLDGNGALVLTETAFFHRDGPGTLRVRNPTLPRAEIDWAMEDRFGRNDVMNFMSPPANPDDPDQRVVIDPTEWHVFLDGCRSSSHEAVTVRRWEVRRQIGPVLLPPRVHQFADDQCRHRIPFPALGTYQVKLILTTATGQQGAAQLTITLKDFLVVGMGDSYASGQGSPALNNEHLQRGNIGAHLMWDFRGKHLSRWSGHVQAALMLERSDPHSSVTFLSVAQSGATIANLISQPQKPNYAPLVESPPQIDHVARAICGDSLDCSTARQIDFLLLSIGGNDIGFSDIIETCGVPINVGGAPVYENCAAVNQLDGTFIPYGRPGWRDNEFTLSVAGMLALLRGGVRGIDSGYPRLNRFLRAGLPLRQGSKILIAEYPNPLIAHPQAEGEARICDELIFKNAVCGAIGFDGDARGPDICPNGHIDQNEAWWASDNVVEPLNGAVDSTRNLSGDGVEWIPVRGISPEFEGHPYCGQENFIVSYTNSWFTQEDKFGTMHPNRGGQEVISRHLAGKMGVDNPFFTTRPDIHGTSEEVAPAVCDGSNLVVGAGCSGHFCDNVELMCKPAPPGVTLGAEVWHEKIAEHGSPDTFDSCEFTARTCGTEFGVSCGAGVLTGVKCLGEFCSRVQPQCRPLHGAHLDHCGWTEWLSDETRWNVFSAGKVANGLRCDGDRCDFMMYYVCDLVPFRTNPTPPL